MNYFLTALFCISSSLCYGTEINFDEDLPETGFVSIQRSPLENFFPTTLTGEEIKAFKKQGFITRDGMKFSVDGKFTATLPYMFQVLTGTDAKFANNVSFTYNYKVKENKICGTYQFNSPYSVRCNNTFDVQLDSETVHNLLDSVLGEKDFIDGGSSKLFKDTSFILIKNTDHEFVQETGVPIRLNGNMQEWLLILAQLNGEDIYSLSEEECQKYGKALFCTYLEGNGLKLSKEGILTTAEYMELNDTLRSGILAHFDLTLDDIPDFRNTDVIALKEGKYFIVNRNKKATLLKL